MMLTLRDWIVYYCFMGSMLMFILSLVLWMWMKNK